MNQREIKRIKKDLVEFVNEFKTGIGREERLHWCQYYLSGLLLDGERKSIQPIAERLPGGNEQAIQQFVNQSPWEHEAIQVQLMNYLQEKIKSSKGVLVLDDTSLPKKGSHSVGVGRQYCGALGKVSNCQSLVTWHYATEEHHFPLLEELYLPQDWINDSKRLQRCGVPAEKRIFKKKWEIALELLNKLKTEKINYEAIAFDAGYGEIKEFLSTLDKRGEIFIGQVPESHHFWPANVAIKTIKASTGRPRRYPELADRSKKALSAKAWALEALSQGTKWKKVKLSLKSKKYTNVIALRVREVNAKWYWRLGAERWLIIEKIGTDSCKYWVSNAPANTSLKTLMGWAHSRWKIEQGYQQLKEELGLDHFEGRSWRGLHHHVTLCFMAYAFLLLLS
jgi:SRSO17 transposase